MGLQTLEAKTTAALLQKIHLSVRHQEANLTVQVYFYVAQWLNQSMWLSCVSTLSTPSLP